MANEGTFTARVFTSEALIPVSEAYISVVKNNPDGTRELVAFLESGRNGLTRSVQLYAPDKENSLSPNENGVRFNTFDVHIYHPLYFSTMVENVQIFDGISTTLPFELIPLPEDENPTSMVNNVDVLPQNL